MPFQVAADPVEQPVEEVYGPFPIETGNAMDGRADDRALVKQWDIQVSFEFGPTKNKLFDVMDGLTWGNDILFDITEGQFKWKHAEIWTHGKKFNDGDTDIQILDTGINYRANAVRGGIDIQGGTVRLGKTHYGMKWNSTYGAMTMAHEWGHYAFYLPDEYVDVDMGTYIISVPWCNNCLMSNGSDIDLHTEYCHPDNHNYSNPNAEAAGSCWEQLVAHYPAASYPATHAELQQDGPHLTEAQQMTFTVHFPDLYIEQNDISISPANPVEGQGTTITAKVHNKDEMLYGDVIEVVFWDGPMTEGDMIGSKSVSLSGNAIDEVTFDWVAEGGTHDIYVQVDPNNQIVEWVEYDNNTAYNTFIIPARPMISASLDDEEADEDLPIVLDLKQYESDIESSDEDLLWTVTNYDDNVIDHIEGEESADDVITIHPVENYFGKTDITLVLTDADGMQDGRTINLTWNAVNDAPVVGVMMLGKDWVYRTTPVLISFNGSDAEDDPVALTPVIEYKHVNKSSWSKLTPQYSNGFFEVLFTPDADVMTGLYDLRGRLTDMDLKSGEYEYLNGSLNVMNGPAIISDYDLADDEAYRGQPLNITIEGNDHEDDGEDLLVEIEFMPKGEDEWYDGATFDEDSGNYDDDSWAVQFIAPADAARGICDIRIRLVDTDGPGTWSYINDTVTIKNSLPVITSFTSEGVSVLRTDGVTLTLVASDFETDNDLMSPIFKYVVGTSSTWRSMDPNELDVTYDDAKDIWNIVFTPEDDADIGEYHIKAILTDGDNEECEAYELENELEVLNNPPSVVIDVKEFADTGEVLVFDGKGSTDIEDGSSLKYAWDFGDGGKASKSRVSHSFNKEGKYNVKLTVTDRDGGSTTEEVMVTVTGSGPGADIGIDMALVAGIAVGVIIAVVIVVILIMRAKGIGPF